jgi:hypothetical protein
MGVRISKSFKVAPGIRVRVNTKSTSVSLGGKGARYTVNSKGRRTATVKVPGTPVSVRQVSGTRKSVLPDTENSDVGGVHDPHEYQDESGSFAGEVPAAAGKVPG